MVIGVLAKAWPEAWTTRIDRARAPFMAANKSKRWREKAAPRAEWLL